MYERTIKKRKKENKNRKIAISAILGEKQVSHPKLIVSLPFKCPADKFYNLDRIEEFAETWQALLKHNCRRFRIL